MTLKYSGINLLVNDHFIIDGSNLKIIICNNFDTLRYDNKSSVAMTQWKWIVPFKSGEMRGFWFQFFPVRIACPDNFFQGKLGSFLRIWSIARVTSFYVIIFRNEGNKLLSRNALKMVSVFTFFIWQPTWQYSNGLTRLMGNIKKI